MMYKLKNINGKVAYLLRTGKDVVSGRMAISSAQHIIDNGKLKKSDMKSYPINVDGKWYFEGEVLKKKASPKKEENA